MSDFEDKLRSLAFREPPRDLRREVLAAAEAAAPAEPRWTWRDWLWPSPFAWGALGLMICGAWILNAAMATPQSPAAVVWKSSPSPAPTLVLYAFQTASLEWLEAQR
jgi:hypothetical protein